MSRNRSGIVMHRRAYGKCCLFQEQSVPEPPPPPPPQIVSTDLLIHFEANDPSSYPGSGLTWVNIGTGGSAYDGTLQSESPPVFIDDAVKSFYFDQYYLGTPYDFYSYNHVSFPRPDAISDDFTYCAWINTTNVGYGYDHYTLMYIVSTETGDLNNDFGVGLDANGCLAYGDGMYGESDKTISSNQQVNTGTWTFVAVTREKATGAIVLYINGYPDAYGTCNIGNTLSTADYVLIGSETDFPGYTFGGLIGAILGNTSVLTPEDILNNFNAQRSIYGV